MGVQELGDHHDESSPCCGGVTDDLLCVELERSLSLLGGARDNSPYHMAMVSLGKEVHWVKSDALSKVHIKDLCGQQVSWWWDLKSQSSLTLDSPSYYDSLFRVILFELQNLLFYPQNGTASSAQISRSVVSDSLRPCGLQHARPPCLC